MDWSNFADWAFKGMLGGLLGYAVHTLMNLKSSVDDLKITMVTAVEKVAWHEKSLERIESRLWDLEAGKRKKI